MNLERNGDLKFKIVVLFWEDLTELLITDNYKDVYFKYYKIHFVKYENYGCFIGKSISIATGENGEGDSYYEFMIGKTSTIPNGYGLDYFNNRYFIVSLSRKLFSLFAIPMNEYNLRTIGVDFPRDQQLILNFINEPGIIDKIIYGDDREYKLLL